MFSLYIGDEQYSDILPRREAPVADPKAGIAKMWSKTDVQTLCVAVTMGASYLLRAKRLDSHRASYADLYSVSASI